MNRPPLPARTRGIQNTDHVAIQRSISPVRSGATQPPVILSTKPVLPPRLPSRNNVPSLPQRSKVVSGVSNSTSSRLFGRTKTPKYEGRDFSVVDEYVNSVPEYLTVAELAHALLCHFPDPVEKVRAIFSWIAFNVAYDAEAFLAGNIPAQSAGNTFHSKKAVCAGYAQLFQELMGYTDIRCIQIGGASKGYGFDPSVPQKKRTDHAWNAVFLENEWRMIDSTWGAGYIDTQFHRKYNSFYFLTDPDEFINDHMPEDDAHQFTTIKYTWENFFALNKVGSIFWQNNLFLCNYVGCGGFIREKQGQEIRIKLLVPKGSKLISSITQAGLKEDTICLFSPCERPGYHEVEAIFRLRQHGSAEIQTYYLPPGQTGTYAGLLTLKVAVSPTESPVDLPGFPVIYGSAGIGTLRSPLIKTIPSRSTQEFIFEDISDDAKTTQLPLYLWLPEGRGPPLKRVEQKDHVRYSLTEHFARLGPVKLAQQQGNSYSFLVAWDVI